MIGYVRNQLLIICNYNMCIFLIKTKIDLEKLILLIYK